MSELEPTPSARDLEMIAIEIRQEVELAELAWRDAVSHAVRAGELLTEAKSQVGHGGWLRWLEANFPASTRTAQGYMRLASHAEDAQALAHLGIEGALKQLAAPRPRGEELSAAEEEPENGERPAQHPVLEAMLGTCEHLTREQWGECLARCGEGFVIELMLIHSYGCVRETDPKHEALVVGREAVEDIASHGGSGAGRWARNVLNGEWPPSPYKTERNPTFAGLEKHCQVYDEWRWSTGDWAVSIGEGAFAELMTLVRLVGVLEEQRVDTGGEN